MINKVYLLWHSYISNELLTICSLEKIAPKGYIMKYNEEAIKAKALGCFLPLSYTKEDIHLNNLPSFFSQRMLTSKYYIEKFNIEYDKTDELSILCYGGGVKNTDNFCIFSEEDYNKFKNPYLHNNLVKK